MKKLVMAAMLFVLLFALSLSIVSAGADWDDPVLCVAGKWLVVNAAKESAVHIIVPDDTPYGAAGHCKTPAPGPVFVKDVVREMGRGHTMMVTVNGSQASQPKLTVSYGRESYTRQNNGHSVFRFNFDLPH
jgi:hypothetical protein